MPLFVIIGYDVADSGELRQETRQMHLQRIQQLDKDKRLLVAGPTPIKHGEPDMSGSVIIADFASIEEAQNWVNDEPYLQKGVYSHVDIKPFLHVLPKSAADIE